MKKERWLHEGEVNAQKKWNSRQLWDEAGRKRLLLKGIPEELILRVEAMEFIFLAKSNKSGKSDCSFKVGGQGFI